MIQSRNFHRKKKRGKKMKEENNSRFISNNFKMYTLNAQCLHFIKASIYSCRTAFSHQSFSFSTRPPKGSEHNPLSCVLLNQQLKVPVTMFTVLKRIWPVSNTTWKDFRDGEDLCPSLVLSVCSLTYWFSWVYWVWRNVLRCTMATSTGLVFLSLAKDQTFDIF